MVKAVLPLMRRQMSGQIINVSSLSGLSPIPFMGIYSASKFALDGYTEALRLEVKSFNIHVSHIEPGFLRTPMMNHRQVAARQVVEYGPWRRRAYDAIRALEEQGPGPELVADAVLKIIGSKRPRIALHRWATGEGRHAAAAVPTRGALRAGTQEHLPAGQGRMNAGTTSPVSSVS